MLKEDFEKANTIAALYLPEIKVFLQEFDEFIKLYYSMGDESQIFR